MKYIFTADWHLQYDMPICRKDDFIETQKRKLKWLGNLQKKYNAVLLDAGDTTDNAREKKQNEFISFLHKYLPKNLMGIAGNHSILYHSMSYLSNSTLGVLVELGKYTMLEKPTHIPNGDCVYGFNFGDDLQHPEINTHGKNIAVYHGMVFENTDDTLNSFTTGYTARQLLTNFPDYDIILTGDNHQTFVVEHEGRKLINPGSLMRITAKQIDHKPCVFLYDSSTNELEKVYAPIENDVISAAHLQQEKDKDERLQAFVKTVDDNYEVGFSFESNLKNYFDTNEITENVKEIVYQCMEG